MFAPVGSVMRTPRRLVLLAGTMLAVPALAETRLVPQNYATIQAALNAANPGDTVLVAPGVYSGPGNRDLNPLGKAVTLRSVGGAATCTIDASDAQPHAGVLFNHNETAATIIDGFTITGGDQFNGGGVCVQSGSPLIRNCVIVGNRADCWGAGVYSNSGASPTFRNCLIAGNDSAAEGGGVFTISSNARIENCTITGNTANSGGGICVFGGLPQFVNCRITGNTASYGGGGYVYQGQLINCTLADNDALDGAGLYTWNSLTVVTNCIIWGNTGSPQLNGQANMTYSIIQGGATGNGNRAVNPLFVNAAAGNYRLAPGSPAIDAGSNPAVPVGVAHDLAGVPRFMDDPATANSGLGGPIIVDMGAFEFGRARVAAVSTTAE